MTPTPTPDEILGNMYTAYRSLRTYEDEGEQHKFMRGHQLTSRGHGKHLRFRTSFSRPSNVFFEYKEVGVGPESEWIHGIVCANASGVVKWWTLRPEPDTSRTLSNALGGFAGVSGRTSYVIPKMLIPELEEQPRIGPAGEMHLRGTDVMEGHECFLVGNEPAGSESSYVMWIDCDSWVLRRTDERKQFNTDTRSRLVEGMRKHMESLPSNTPREVIETAIKHMESQAGNDFDSESTTIWRPHVNPDIAPSVFEFRQPGKEVFASLGVATPPPPSTSSSTAPDIIRATLARYATCRTYRDTGETITTRIDGPNPWDRRTERRTFKTYFRRPDSLFIEYWHLTPGPQLEWGHAVVWAEGTAIRDWTTFPSPTKVEEPQTLHNALSSLMMVSGGTPGYTPWLLLPHEQFCPLPEPSTAELVGEEAIGGTLCDRLRGLWKRGQEVEVWIDRNTLLMKRMSWEMKIDAASRARIKKELQGAEAKLLPDDPRRKRTAKLALEWGSASAPEHATTIVTTFDGEFDADIDPAVFEFRPPESTV
jgi:hypothetical protein